MKKILFSVMTLLALAGMSKAQNALSVADITLPQNSDAALVVSFQFDVADTYTGYSFNLELPEQLEFVMAEGTDVACTKGSCHDASHSVTANLSEGLVKVAGLSLSSKPLSGTSGTLLTFAIKPVGVLTVGQTYTGTIKDILLVPIEGAKQNLAQSTFTITIGEPVDTRTILDETSTTAPTAASGVDVRVKRAIKAGNWSTICLPFAIPAEKMTATFGEGVEVKDFISYETAEEGNDIVGITIKFGTVTAMEANHPYLIKVANDISYENGFTIDGVDINPEESPCVEYDNGLSGKKRKVLGSFVGTYVADFDFYSEAENYPLFISGNKFHYATENTMHMKAFRGYFDFVDALTSVEDASAHISIGDETTGIANIRSWMSDDTYYDLQGRKVMTPKKGLYIVNGRKVVVK